MLFDGFELNNLIYVRLDSALDVFKAIAEISILAYIIYAVLNLVRETRAWQLLKGVILIVIVMVLANIFDLRTLSFILNNTFGVLAIGTLVVFQPEMRRGLEQIGRSTLKVFYNLDAGQLIYNTIDALARACRELSGSNTGALIVIERQTKLGEIIDTGILLGADVSAELLINIFTKNTPLHDGAVVIRGARIEAATCYLPLTEDADINKELGTRHRAAIGMAEVSDAIILVVSEETGLISYIQDGVLERGLGEEALRRLLKENLTIQAAPDRKILFLGSGKKAKNE
jgi:diadenylate cyclase